VDKTPKDLRQRKGKILIYGEIVDNKPEDVMEILSHIVVVRAEFEFLYGGVYYYGYSHLFDPIPEGEIAPEYDITLVRTGSGYFRGKTTIVNAFRRDFRYDLLTKGETNVD
jgi:hypothetical protein